MALNDDIKIAQKIVGNSYHNIDYNNVYHEYSFIYKTTNEVVSEYQTILNNNKKILTVIASGDQILNSILGGTKEIDCFDISVFPKYFLNLKLAAIQTLTKEQYINYFFNNFNYQKELDENLYEIIRPQLDQNTLKFWDSLYNYFDGFEIYNSTLFSSEPYNLETIKLRNKYLQDDNYEILKNNISKINIKNIYEESIYNLSSKLDDKYDLINLSSIIYYQDILRLNEYKNFLLNNFKLNNRGKILTYLYNLKESTKKLIENNFYENEFKLQQIDKEISNDGILVYTKSL